LLKQNFDHGSRETGETPKREVEAARASVALQLHADDSLRRVLMGRTHMGWAEIAGLLGIGTGYLSKTSTLYNQNSERRTRSEDAPNHCRLEERSGEEAVKVHQNHAGRRKSQGNSRQRVDRIH